MRTGIMRTGAAALLFSGVLVFHSGPAQALPPIGDMQKCKGPAPAGVESCAAKAGSWVMCTKDGDYMCCHENAQGGKDCEQIERLRRPPGRVRPPVSPGQPPVRQ